VRQDIQIEWCPVTRLAELQRLIENHWRAGHVLASDEALLRWQYRHLTRPDHLAIMVAIDATSDEIIGCLGLIQAPFNDRGRERLALWMSMWLLVPEARGQGIGFALLDRAIREGHEVIACVGFNDITMRSPDGCDRSLHLLCYR
jgi:RimJ/RimL family protein N-acetyltransferase